LPPLWDATPLMVAMSAGRNAVKPPFFSARRYHAECKCCDTVKERVLGRALACQGSGIACFLIGLKDSATCPMLTCTRLMPLVRPCIMCSHVGMVCHTHTHTHTHTHRRQVSGYRNSQRRVGVRVLYSSLGCGSLGGREEGVGVLYSSARHHGSRVVYSSARQAEFLWCVVGRHDAWRVLDRSPHQANRRGCHDGRLCTVWPTLHAVPCKVLASVHATCIGACVRRAQQGTRANKEAGRTCQTRKARCKVLCNVHPPAPWSTYECVVLHLILCLFPPPALPPFPSLTCTYTRPS
jgi:hypothetical protein